LTKCKPYTFFSNIQEIVFQKVNLWKVAPWGKTVELPFCLVLHKESPFCFSRHFDLLLGKVTRWEEHGWSYHVVFSLGKPFFPQMHLDWKNCPIIHFFITFVHGRFFFFEKGLNLVPLVEGGHSNHSIIYFSSKTLCKKYN
jgi:hypothetical protein